MLGIIYKFIHSFNSESQTLCTLCGQPAQLTQHFTLVLEVRRVHGTSQSLGGSLSTISHAEAHICEFVSCEFSSCSEPSLYLTLHALCMYSYYPFYFPVVDLRCRTFNAQQLFGTSQTKPVHFEMSLTER